MTAAPNRTSDAEQRPARLEFDPAAARRFNEDLKARVDCRDVARALWSEPVRAYPRCNAYPHLAGEKHASLMVYADHFQNFGSGAEAGDVFSLIQYAQGCDFATAKRWLVEYLGGVASRSASVGCLARPASPKCQPLADKTPPSGDWQAAIGRLIDVAAAALFKEAGSQALDWLHSRGLTDDTIKAARLGFNPTWHDTRLRDPDDNKKTIRVGPGLLIPIYDEDTLWC